MATPSQPLAPPTAERLGFMRGYPPAPTGRVTHANQLLGPYNRWSFQHNLQLNATADTWRGAGPVFPLEYNLCDIGDVTYQNRAGNQVTFDQMVEQSYTDGILVLHQGRVIYERYLNGMAPETIHAWASCSKSMTGILAALLVHEGQIDLDALVTDYLPELLGSGFAGATVRQAMDMTTAVRFSEDEADPVSESWQYGVALGWRERPAGYFGPSNGYEFLPTMRASGRHGERFTYITPNTDIVAWIIRRTQHASLASVMGDRIWARLGAERDAFWIVDSLACETSGSGLLSTLRDMARFGQLLLQSGRLNDQEIIPASVVADIGRGGDPAVFARGPAAGPANMGWSYHNQWWNTHNPHGAHLALGYGGQMLYIDPTAEMVIAKMSSYPTPTPAGNEFYAALAAFPALAERLTVSRSPTP